eukprot:scaffold3290_cov259-Pinguiococcus_pyrenoidosus.AAC.8
MLPTNAAENAMNADAEDWDAHLRLRQWFAEARKDVRRQVYRVSQLDALLLDAQLISLLTKQLERALQDVSARLCGADPCSNTHSCPQADVTVVSRRKAALKALLELAYYAWALWRLGATPGMQMQGLRLGPRGGNVPQKLVFLVVVVGAKWWWPQLKRWAIRRHRGHARALRGFESVVNAAATLNFVLFLYGAEFPSLLLRVLGLRMEYSPTKPGERHVANGTEGTWFGRQKGRGGGGLTLCQTCLSCRTPHQLWAAQPEHWVGRLLDLGLDGAAHGRLARHQPKLELGAGRSAADGAPRAGGTGRGRSVLRLLRRGVACKSLHLQLRPRVLLRVFSERRARWRRVPMRPVRRSCRELPKMAMASQMTQGACSRLTGLN